MTRSCVPALVKVMPWPALMVTLVFPEKLKADMVIVAAPLEVGVVALAVGWTVLVGALEPLVAVGLVLAVELEPPQAASSRRQARTPSGAQHVTRAGVVREREDNFDDNIYPSWWS